MPIHEPNTLFPVAITACPDLPLRLGSDDRVILPEQLLRGAAR